MTSIDTDIIGSTSNVGVFQFFLVGHSGETVVCYALGNLGHSHNRIFPLSTAMQLTIQNHMHAFVCGVAIVLDSLSGCNTFIRNSWDLFRCEGWLPLPYRLDGQKQTTLAPIDTHHLDFNCCLCLFFCQRSIGMWQKHMT